MAYEEEKISSPIAVWIYKLFLIPFYVLLSVAFFILSIIDNSPKTIFEGSILFLLLFSNIVVIYLFKRLKIINVNEQGFKIEKDLIPWTNLKNIYLPFFSPMPLLIIYKQNEKRKFVWTTISPMKHSITKKWIEQFRPKH
ncbi:MAG: hypothetical protein GY699_13585 [Desulfobacteraceae bacterium]|nr:hypothetical protein [Desulfobacteraceae bacterium]